MTLTMPGPKGRKMTHLTPDEQQALMREISDGMTGKQAEAPKVVQATDEAPPAKRGRPKKS